MLPGITPDLALVNGTGGGSPPPYGGGSLDTQTVQSGADGTLVNGNRRRGFILSALGSCSPGTSAIYSGALIRELASEEESGDPGTFDTILTISGTVANSGWTSLNVGGSTTLLRANATFSTATNSTWTWTGTGNLFGSVGSSHVVGFN